MNPEETLGHEPSIGTDDVCVLIDYGYNSTARNIKPAAGNINLSLALGRALTEPNGVCLRDYSNGVRRECCLLACFGGTTM